ncbi:hypothetical protein BDR03DRAFT_987134, partial [Suillus americanus]
MASTCQHITPSAHQQARPAQPNIAATQNPSCNSLESISSESSVELWLRRKHLMIPHLALIPNKKPVIGASLGAEQSGLPPPYNTVVNNQLVILIQNMYPHSQRTLSMVTVSTSKSKRVHTKLSDVQKFAHHEKLVKLTNAITTAQDVYQEEACTIAKENGRQKLNDENEGLMQMKGHALGDQTKLSAFSKANRTWLVSSYLQLMLADKNHLRENVTCTNPKALQKDVKSTFKTMQTESNSGLASKHVQASRESKVRSFIKDVLGMELKHFALKVESWVVGNFDSAGTASQQLSLTKLVSLCHQHIQDGLDIILPTLSHPPNKKVKMNYNNYEGKIMETYGIALEHVPGKIGHHKDLIELCNLLFKGTCSWSVAKNKEHQAHGEQIYKA